ncbi:hypothetical protein [Sphingomonas koreensis]
MTRAKRKWSGARQDAMTGQLLAGFAATAASTSLAGWIGGGRAALGVVGVAMTVLLPYAAYIQWRDFRDGAMRHGPGLRWHVTRARQPFRFWMVTIVGALCVPLGIAMLALLWWAVIWGSWT